MKTTLEQKNRTVWQAEVRASFKKVVAFDLVFMSLGAMIGAGIATAVIVG